ncbi:MAG: TIGR03960 family B12-binding radical SAM protein [Deltaproteobacteria bacterium]|nr:TIGR03960 family B12-binding radical SAM protein [Deltaproteobacteria bacterium]
MGEEIHAVKKDLRTIDVSFALAFPDVYEVGMSHVGLRILYHILNRQNWVAAERVFCPWIDLETELRNHGLALRSLESRRSLAEFDIVGFSIQHELSLTNVLTMLNLGGIPFLAREREGVSPLIVAGGPACFNPEPFALIFDAILVGDGEDAVLELCEVMRDAKRTNVSKEELLVRMSQMRGMYIPKFFNVSYGARGTISAIEPGLTGYRKIQKAIVPDINLYPLPDSQIVPYAELVHDRLTLEISRGCTRGCRFCQAGMIYRPVREREPGIVLESAAKGLAKTGFEELSLLSLSSGDYGCLGPLLKALMDRQAEGKTAISLPSLRIDSLDKAWFEQIKRVRKTGFTLAPEAGNDRIRRIINKKLTDDEIFSTADKIFFAGWEMIKLYFMIGLPGEEDEDVLDIVRLVKEVSRRGGRRGKVNASIAAFVPKAHTPFMWMPQIPLMESRRKIALVRGALKEESRVRLKWNQPEMSWLEGIFSRGDRRLTEVLFRAWKKGARFDAWSEQFALTSWMEAFSEEGVEPDFYLHRARDPEEILPWDHIRSGITKTFLLAEHRKALEGIETPDCRGRCLSCGVCDHESVGPVLYSLWEPTGVKKNVSASRSIEKYRVVFCKTGLLRHLSHLELVRLFIRALRRARIPIVFSAGYHPMPKISFAAALPVGTESLHETMDIQVYGPASVSIILDRLAHQLPAGIRVLSTTGLAPGSKAPRLKESRYEISLKGSPISTDHMRAFLGSEAFFVSKKGKREEKRIDVRPLVKSMEALESGRVRLVLNHTQGPEVKPAEIVKRVFDLDEKDILKVVKTDEVVE